MYRLTAKNLWAHKLRLALTGVAVVLGVAFMAGTMVLTDTMAHTFDTMFETNNAGIDVLVQQPETVGAEWGDTRERVPADAVDTIRSVEGVDAAAGSIEGFAQLVNADGTVASLDGLGVTIGANWVADDELNPFQLESGQAPAAADEVVLDKGTIDDQGWELGDDVTVIAQGEPTTLTLVGSATFGDIDGLPGSSLVAVNDETAQTLFAEPGRYDVVAVSAAEGVDPEVLSTRIDDALGADTYEVVTGAADTEADQNQLREDLSFFNTFLLAFAFVSLFVGTFIIYNTFSILVAQRTKDMAMLRAIGASRGQVLRSVLAESAIVGLLAGAIGLGLGVAMSFGLRELLGAVGLEIPSGPTVVTATTIVTAFVIGSVVTVLSAVLPAFRASRVRPIAALRDVAVDRSGLSRTRVVVGMVMTAAGVAAFAAGVVGGGENALALLGLGTIVVFLGVFVLGPVIARPVVGLLAAPVRRVTGITGRLAGENAARSPKRTAATASALMVGVALVGFITILAASTKASVAEGVDRSLRADYVVDSGAWDDGGFGPGLADEVRGLDEVETVSPMRTAPVQVDGGDTTVHAVDTAVFDGLFDVEVTQGALDAVGEGGVAVQADDAESHGLALGDRVPVTFARTGTVELEVAAIFDTEVAGAGETPYLVDLSTFEANVTDQFDQRIYVSTPDSVSAESSRAALETLLADQPNAELQDQAEVKEAITSEIDMILNLVYGLLALAVVIALIGIANTLALSIHERRREIGLLRAVGMTRGQIRAAVRWEAVLIALLGTALGSAIAVAGAWGIVKALADQDVTTFSVPPVQLAVIALLAAVAGVVAAVAPARRAARLDVLDAIGAA